MPLHSLRHHCNDYLDLIHDYILPPSFRVFFSHNKHEASICTSAEIIHQLNPCEAANNVSRNISEQFSI